MSLFFKIMKGLTDLYKQYERESAIQGEYGVSVTELSRTIWELVSHEATNTLFKFSPICEILDQIAAVNQDMAKVKARVGDDLRDIVERSKALYNLEAKQIRAVKAHENAKLALKEAINRNEAESKLPTYLSKKATLEAAIAKAKVVKHDSLILARDLTETLIDQRKRFEKFRYNRSKDAFIRLGYSLKDDTRIEASLFRRFAEGMKLIREEKELSPEVLQGTVIEKSEVVLSSHQSASQSQEKIAEAVISSHASASHSHELLEEATNEPAFDEPEPYYNEPEPAYEPSRPTASYDDYVMDDSDSEKEEEPQRPAPIIDEPKEDLFKNPFDDW